MALQNEEIDLARYKSAAAEVDSTSRDEGLWIKAFAESGGDEKSSRAMYIKLRVERLRRNAVADAARRVVGQTTAAPSANTTVADATPMPARATTPPPPPATHQGPARVAQTLYDIVGVDRHADAAVISAAIQAKEAQGADSSVASEDRQRRGILLQNAAEVLLNVEKRRAYDERVFRAETAAPTSPTSTEIPRAAYASQPVSGMIDAEDVEEVPTAGKRWAAYAGWFVVWFVFHSFVAAPVLKAQMGWLVGAVAMGCNLALFLSGIALLRRKFNVANGDDARKFWIILGLSVLVLMGLRSYAAMRTNQVPKAAAVADARRVAAENSAAWEKLVESDSVAHYINPSTIRKDGNLRSVWYLQQPKQRDPSGVMSRRGLMEYDCKDQRYKFLSVSAYSEPMAGGETLGGTSSPGEWNFVPPNNVFGLILEIVCKK
jgi:hypothetical protein